ncbi:MAG: hypothetical protein KME10_27040 [Plectolyngbya sp. WJT66-NPBG17]|nr:hypothetical protein [Plectolyngbya sp. WJT66-NPBG17]
MSKPLQTLIKFGGMLTVLFSATTVSPLKASAQSLLPDINLLEGGQICLALCASPRSTVPPSQSLPLSNQGLGALPSQVMQLPGQVLQLPQQILSPQGSQIVRSNPPVIPNNPPMMPPGNPPFVPQGNAPVPSQPMQPSQASRPSFLQKIAPVLPQLIQQFSR